MSDEAPEPNSIEDFSNRFYELQKEAKAFGIGAVVVLVQDDRFDDTETKMMTHTVGPVVGLGCLEWGRITFERL